MPSGKPLDPAKDFRPLPINPQSLSVVRQGLVGAYNATSDIHRRMGRQFYPQAHDEASKIGRKAGGDVHTGAGVVAALSPAADYYEVNVPAAHQAVSHLTEAHVKSLMSGDRSVLDHPHFSALRRQSTDNIVKAARIMRGEHPDTVLGPLKTNDFHHTIVDPDTSGHYTFDTIMHDEGVDRHMQWGVNRSLTGRIGAKGNVTGRYPMMKEAGLQAAREQGVKPSEHQASIWFRGQERRGRQFGQADEVPTGRDRDRAEAAAAAIHRNVRKKRGIPTAEQLGNKAYEGWS